jgi:hypothetical protein
VRARSPNDQRRQRDSEQRRTDRDEVPAVMQLGGARARRLIARIRQSLAQASVKARFGASLVPSISRALLASSGAGGA